MPKDDLTPGSGEILYVPLGGAGQIGMNLYMYGHDGQWLMVDCGISFAHDGIPGVEVMMPDPEFLLSRTDKIAGLVVTHGHEDHIGAIPYLIEDLGCPIYATSFTAELIRLKLEEAGLAKKVKIHVLPIAQQFQLGKFGLEFVPMTHSIPQSCALHIRTKAGNIFHSGDWKFDPEPMIGPPADFEYLRKIGDGGILAMTCDSTNVFEVGQSGSERRARDGLRETVAKQKNKVAVTLFASNVARLQSAAMAAADSGRHVALVGRSLDRIYDVATRLKIIPEFPNLVETENIGQFPNDKILYICTGCQGERRSALARIADESHPHVRLDQGDTVIFSSREIPGNEIAIQTMQNALSRRNVHIISAGDAPVHVSGHPYRDELKKIYSLIRPQIAVPMHGEPRHLHEHRDLADECGVGQSIAAENGELIRITASGAEKIGEVECGILGLDGEQWIPLDGNVIRDRHKFTWGGAMMISLALSNKKGELRAYPHISLLGIVEKDQIDDLSDAIAQKIEQSLVKLSKKHNDDNALAEELRIVAQRVVAEYCGKKPLGRVHILRV